jgi:hypothetical protein
VDPKKSYFSNIRYERKLFLRALDVELAKPNVLARKSSNSGHHGHVSAATDLFLGQMSEVTSNSSSLRSPGQARLIDVDSALERRLGRKGISVTFAKDSSLTCIVKMKRDITNKIVSSDVK